MKKDVMITPTLDYINSRGYDMEEYVNNDDVKKCREIINSLSKSDMISYSKRVLKIPYSAFNLEEVRDVMFDELFYDVSRLNDWIEQNERTFNAQPFINIILFAMIVFMLVTTYRAISLL